MKVKDSFDFALSKPINYQSGGEHKDCQLLVLTSPTNKQHALRVKLKQAFQRAVMGLQKGGAFDHVKDDPKEKDEGVTGEGVIALLYASDIDMVAAHDDFKRLLISGVCKAEGEEPFTAFLYDQMSGEDTDKLFGEYMAVFIK